jgi:hypothetical protein
MVPQLRSLSKLKFPEIRNDTRYGLAAIVWSENVKRALSMAKEIRARTVWINTPAPLYCEAPFGGYKESGLGRELGRAGLEEYTTTWCPPFKRRSVMLAPILPKPIIPSSILFSLC